MWPSFRCALHRADLFRYAVLYIHGGFYADIKTELLYSLDSILTEPNTIYTVLSNITSHTIHNGVIATPKYHPIFLDFILYMVSGDNHHHW